MTLAAVPREPAEAPVIIGFSPAIRKAVRLARQFARTDLPVLIIGPTGTGKELLAQSLHAWSGCAGELVDLNCATLPDQLVESTLFGSARGAYTGSVAPSEGLVARADSGTLFLDELCSLQPAAQGKLLRTLETGEYRRVGETQKRRSRFRLVSAVREDLEQRVADREFRDDLLHRVAGIVIELPPLRDRIEDVRPLADYFARMHARTVSACAVSELSAHDWPGNVRELRAVLERAVQLDDAPLLTSRSIAEARTCGMQVVRSALRRVEEDDLAERIRAACRSSGGDAAQVAALLGMSRSTFFRRLMNRGLSFRRLRQSQSSGES